MLATLWVLGLWVLGSRCDRSVLPGRLEAQQAAQQVGAGQQPVADQPSSNLWDLYGQLGRLPVRLYGWVVPSEPRVKCYERAECMLNCTARVDCLPLSQALEELEGGIREPAPAGSAAGRLAFSGTGVDQRAQVRPWDCCAGSAACCCCFWGAAGW